MDRGAPLQDNFVDYVIQLADGTRTTACQEVGYIEWKKEGLPSVSDKPFGHHLHGSADSRRGAANLRAIQAQPHNFEGDTHQVFVNVACLVVTPRIDHAAGRFSHNGSIGKNIFTAESGLNKRSLPLPELSFAGQQSLAENASESAVVGRFREIARIRHQDVLDFTGMHQKKNGNVDKTHINDVAVFPGALRVESQPVSGDRRQISQEEMPLGPR